MGRAAVRVGRGQVHREARGPQVAAIRARAARREMALPRRPLGRRPTHCAVTRRATAFPTRHSATTSPAIAGLFRASASAADRKPLLDALLIVEQSGPRITALSK